MKEWFHNSRIRRLDGVMARVMLAAVWPCLGLALDLSVQTDNPKVNLSVVRRADVEYYLVTRDNPLEFDVTTPESAAASSGASWLRIYTRLWWPAGVKDSLRYHLALWQDGMERPIQFQTRLSDASYGPARHRVGAWRSFFVELPRGKSHYRLVTTGPETVAVRMVFQAPKPWRRLAIAGLKELVIAGGEEPTGPRYYEIQAGKPVRLLVSGPCRVRVWARLNFDPALVGQQNFVLMVKESDKTIVKKNLRVGRDLGARFENRPEIVPSRERSVRFELGAGTHELTIMVTGTIAKSAAIAVETLPDEKYE